MTAIQLCSEADQDRLLLDIYELSRRFVVLKVRAEDVDDVVHDIAADCLVKLRTRVWTEWPDNVHAFVWKLVKDHLIDRHRRSHSSCENDAEHHRDRTAEAPGWVSPVHVRDDAAIHAFQERLLEKLPARCRTAFRMVRDEGASYAEVAEALHVSRETVHNDISDVRRAFRAELRRQGIEIPYRRAGGRLGGTQRGGAEARLKPYYPAPRVDLAQR